MKTEAVPAVNTFLVTLPILLPVVGAALALLLRRYHRVRSYGTLAVAMASLLITLSLLAMVWRGGAPLVFQPGNWPAPFGISLVADLLGVFMAALSQLILVAGILYALGSGDGCIRYPAFFPLLLMLGAALTGVMFTGDIFNLYVFIELLMISGVILAAISDDRAGPEAAYKYFYISLVASWFLLLAIGILYVEYGELNMADLAGRIAANPDAPLLTVAIVLLFAAFMIKSAVFPLHFWQPDLYSAAPTAVTAVLAGAVSKVGVYGFLRMTTLLFVAQADIIRAALIVLGLAGILFGGLAAIGTAHAKRTFAYSSIAQIGFILIAIGWGTPLALMTALVFTFSHALIKAALMMLTGAVASWSQTKTATYSGLRGLGRNMPLAGILFLIASLALAGIPPTSGFISKMLLFSGGIAAERFASLALLGVASILTLVYGARAFMRIWWQAPENQTELQDHPDHLLAPGMLVILVVAIGIWAEPLITLAERTAFWLGNPTLYISSVLGG
ncbi:MAG: hypothetical protein J5I90_20475 [Caldilineales bacterium]|nr:hypothetical protein [Caldilineales bacterium]